MMYCMLVGMSGIASVCSGSLSRVESRGCRRVPLPDDKISNERNRYCTRNSSTGTADATARNHGHTRAHK